MALKKLRDFVKFDEKDFFKNKKLGFMSCEIWKERTVQDDPNSAVEKGTKVTVVIKEDDTSYNLRNADPISNKGETFVVKVPNKKVEDFKDFNMFVTDVRLESVEKASVYGEFSNNLSIVADVVKAVVPVQNR